MHKSLFCFPGHLTAKR